MKIAIISDIHSNPSALNAVLKDIKGRNCKRIVCLGDIVGYGYDPDTCINICRKNKVECFLGNHDAGLIGKLPLRWFNSFAKNAILRQQSLVSDDNKKWLESLPYSKVEGAEDEFAYALTHGELMNPENFDYIQGYSDAICECHYMKEKKIDVLFVGHTHYANIFSLGDDYRLSETYIDLEDEDTYDLSRYEKSIVNVGSCGYPRNQPYTIYGIYDTSTHEVYHRIMPFDFNDYLTNMKKHSAEIPLWIESRMEEALKHPVLYR